MMILLRLITFLFLISPILKARGNDSIGKPHARLPKTLEIAIPATMVAYGVASLGSKYLKERDLAFRDLLIKNKSLWRDSWDDYTQFAPAVAAFSMKLSGMPSVHRLQDMCVLYALSNALGTSVVLVTKEVTDRQRPNDSNRHSFPSGHTAIAFIAAEFLHQEYGDRSVWISIGGYGMASLVGLSRIYRNKHWLSDVIAGAGTGILATKMVYLSYPFLKKTFGGKNKKRQTVVFPAYENGNLTLGFSCGF
ncbi:MAG: phosphatase PAP2 family protein [Dysgonamonadaceae bacterium]|jgi:hypothetical protein|nr:phosphatase PAP2 family protein [Dysgonamonadaceae bacterium]